MTTETMIAPVGEHGQHLAPVGLEFPDLSTARSSLEAVRQFQRDVQELLQEGQDYGPPWPGSTEKTLLQPGAEKLAQWRLVRPRYRDEVIVEDWTANPPLFAYRFTCELVHMMSGMVVGEGQGACSTRESKYRYRDDRRKCPSCGSGDALLRSKRSEGGYFCWDKRGGCGANFPEGSQGCREIESQKVGRVENMDTADLQQTVLAIAQKRSMVKAIRTFCCLSDIFTQDAEDFAQGSAPAPAQQETPEQAPPPDRLGTCPKCQTPFTWKNERGQYHIPAGDFPVSDPACDGAKFFCWTTGEITKPYAYAGEGMAPGPSTPSPESGTVGSSEAVAAASSDDEAFDALGPSEGQAQLDPDDERY